MGDALHFARITVYGKYGSDQKMADLLNMGKSLYRSCETGARTLDKEPYDILIAVLEDLPQCKKRLVDAWQKTHVTEAIQGHSILEEIGSLSQERLTEIINANCDAIFSHSYRGELRDGVRLTNSMWRTVSRITADKDRPYRVDATAGAWLAVSSGRILSQNGSHLRAAEISKYALQQWRREISIGLRLRLEYAEFVYTNRALNKRGIDTAIQYLREHDRIRGIKNSSNEPSELFDWLLHESYREFWGCLVEVRSASELDLLKMHEPGMRHWSEIEKYFRTRQLTFLRADASMNPRDEAIEKIVTAIAVAPSRADRLYLSHSLVLAYARRGDIDSARKMGEETVKVATQHGFLHTATKVVGILDELRNIA